MAAPFRSAVDATAEAAATTTAATATTDHARAAAGRAGPYDHAADTESGRAHANRGAGPDHDPRGRTEGVAAPRDRNAAAFRLHQSQGRPHRRPSAHAVPRNRRSEIAAGRPARPLGRTLAVL